MIRPTLAAAAAAAVVLALGRPASAQQAAAWAEPESAAKAPAAGSRWVVDLIHSQVDFRVRHLVGRVRGTFTNWYATIETGDQDWTRGKVKVQVQTRSVNTGNGFRDADLRSPRFFHADSFPQMTFEGTGIVATDSTVRLEGILTIKGHSRPVVLEGEYRGIMKDKDGHERIAFDATTVVDRRDFGMWWNELVDNMTAIGTEVEITIALEAVRVG